MKSKSTAILLLLFFGGLGAHKFYLGSNLLGVLYLVFCWSGIPLFLSIIDLFILAYTDKRKFNDKYNQEYKEWLYAQE